MRPLHQVSIQSGVFSRFLEVKLPNTVSYSLVKKRSQPFTISFSADGEIPFPQIIIRINGKEHIYNNEKIQFLKNFEYETKIPEGDLPIGTISVQIEGCRRKEWQQSSGEDWVKWFGELQVIAEILTSTANTGTTASSSIKKKN
jgi:hypothetical protein